MQLFGKFQAFKYIVLISYGYFFKFLFINFIGYFKNIIKISVTKLLKKEFFFNFGNIPEMYECKIFLSETEQI